MPISLYIYISIADILMLHLINKMKSEVPLYSLDQWSCRKLEVSIQFTILRYNSG